MRELREAVRRWAQTPVVTAVVVVSLALGIGANTAIFSLIDALLIKPLPVRDAERLVRVEEPGFRTHGLPVWEQIRSGSPVLDATAVVTLLRPDISPTRERRSAQGLSVSGNFFEVLGVGPAIGRLFTPADDLPGSPAVAVTDYEFWQSQYGGRRDILGAAITMDGKPFTIVGVTERGFFGLTVGRRFDVAIPLNGYRQLYPNAISAMRNSFVIVGRLHPRQTLREAESALRAQQPRYRSNLRVPDDGPYLKQPLALVPIGTGLSTAQNSYTRPLLVLMILVALVLTIACINVATLLLARGSARAGEFATQIALGASRWRVVRSVIADSLVIAVAGAAAAAVMGLWCARAIVSAVTVNQSGPLATWIDVRLDSRVLVFTIVVGVLTALVFGAGPALHATRVDPLEAMRRRSRGVSGGHGYVAPVLAGLQLALAFVLVAGGAVLVRSFVAMTWQDLGFDAQGVMVAVPDFSRSRLARSERIAATEHIRDRIASLPGIDGATVVESTPFGLGTATVPVTVPGSTTISGNSAVNFVGSQYFETMRMTLRAGRTFAPYPREAGQSAIVNEQFVRRYISSTEPLGHIVQLQLPGRTQVEIVGVVADARFDSLREPVLPSLYVPFTPRDETWIELNIRSRLPESTVKAHVLDTMERLAPDASVEFRSIEGGLRDTAARDRVVAWLAAAFAVLALLLAAIGLYGLMSHHVIRRRQEFGVRVAIGATPSSLAAMVLTQAMSIVTVGILTGFAVWLALRQLIAALLFDVTATDPSMMAGAACFLATVTIGAGLIPARRAARIDPMAALRDE